jgi:hypothetical protein
VEGASARLEAAEREAVADLDAAWLALTGTAAPGPADTAEEREMAGRVYVPTPDIGAFDDAMGKVKPVEGLHAMMRFEVYNFAAGRRSAWEVYEAVAAEALSAGEWYYGRVTPQDVQAALDAAAAKGAFTVRKR